MVTYLQFMHVHSIDVHDTIYCIYKKFVQIVKFARNATWPNNKNEGACDSKQFVVDDG